MNNTFFKAPFDSDYWMTQNGVSVGLNMPKALKGEELNILPPYARRKFFLTDDYPAAPSNWMRSEGKTASYFVAIQEDHGMWLDFNKNNDCNYELAILISVQGINPITGLPCTDNKLEQYVESCPKCQEKFQANRYCKKCEMNWPKQNYISTTGQPSGQLWLDGFKTAEGIVRQYIFTKEECRGVAENIIGKDKVYAIGISFFFSKTQKQKPTTVYREEEPITYICKIPNSDKKTKKRSKPTISYGYSDSTDSTSAMPGISPGWQNRVSDFHNETKASDATKGSASFTRTISNNTCPVVDTQVVQAWLSQTPNDPNTTIVCSHSFDLSDLASTSNFTHEVEADKFEVGAGAKIDQKIYDDPNPLDFWRDEAEAIIVINYASEECIKKIIDAGKINKTTKKEGFLQGIPVGN